MANLGVFIQKDNGYFFVTNGRRIDLTPEQSEVVDKQGLGDYDLEVSGEFVKGYNAHWNNDDGGYPGQPDGFEDIVVSGDFELTDGQVEQLVDVLEELLLEECY